MSSRRDDLKKVDDFQRRLVEHATEFNQAYRPTYDVRRMWLDLSDILSARTGDRAKLEERMTSSTLGFLQILGPECL